MVKGGKNQGASNAKRKRNRDADEPTTADPQPQPETTAEADAGGAGVAPVPTDASAEAGPATAESPAPATSAGAEEGAESDSSSPAGDAEANADGTSPGGAPEPAAATPTPSAPENPKATADASTADAHGTDTAQADGAGAAPVSAAASGDAWPAAAKTAAPSEQARAGAGSDSGGSSADDAESTPVAEESAAAAHGAAAGNTSAGADTTTPAQADHAASGPVAAEAAMVAASGDPAPTPAESTTSEEPAAANGVEPVDPAKSGASPAPTSASPDSGGAVGTAGDGVASADAAAASVAADGVAASGEPVPPVAREPVGGASANELSISPAFLPPAVTPVSRRRRRWKRVLVSMAVAMAVLISAAGAAAYFLYRQLDGQITTDAVDMKIGPERPAVPREAYGAVNILLMGSDDRTGDNIEYGDIGEGTKRSDTTILLHLSADRKSSVAVSIPRDLMVQIPSCVRDDGTQSRAYKDQFNHAFEIGGSACTIKTVEQMTQVKIDHHIVVDFTGFKRMVDAVEGVEVCLSEPLKDRAAKLDLPAGRRTLDGEQALAYVRARKNLDDGSDTMRMTRQQRFLASLMNKVESNGVLFNPIKLYELLDAGTRSIAADPGLDSLDELTKLSKSVAGIPSEKSAFLTVPRQPYRYDRNRDELVQPDADALFTAIRFDRIAVGKADAASPVEPGGTVEIHDSAMPKATSTTGGPTGKATGKATDEPSDPATDESSDAPTDSPSGSATDTPATDGADPSASATGSATASPTGSATGSPAPTGSGSAPPAASPRASGGPIVTVTGRTVDQDVCA